MIKLTLTIVCLTCTVWSIGAQAIALDGSGGYAEDGYGVMVAANFMARRSWGYVEAGVFVSRSHVKGDLDSKMPYGISTVQIGYFKQVHEQYGFRKYAIFLGGGITAGQELVNKGNVEVLDGLSFDGATDFIFGPYVGLAGEYRLGNGGVSLLLKGYEYFHFNSSLGKFTPFVGGGLRFML